MSRTAFNSGQAARLCVCEHFGCDWYLLITYDLRTVRVCTGCGLIREVVKQAEHIYSLPVVKDEATT